MNIKTIADKDLIFQTEKLVREERELLMKILEHLREIDRRRLFSSLGFKSLFEFAVRKLGYSEDQAYRRIDAMRLLKELPEIETKICRGEISLTHIGIARSYFKTEARVNSNEMSKSEKLEVFDKIAGKPIREAERIAISLSSAPSEMKPDRVKPVSADKLEYKFLAPASLQEKVEQLKGLLAHKYPGITMGELFEKLCDLGIEHLDPARPKVKRSKATQPRAARQTEGKGNQKMTVEKPKSPATTSPSDVGNKVAAPSSDAVNGAAAFRPLPLLLNARRNGRARISQSTKRGVIQSAGGRCVQCGSQYALEIDHVIPLAKGGTNEPANLRVLCRSCNQRAAIEQFGTRFMDRYLN